MTKKRRKELTKHFSQAIAFLADGYLPRNKHLFKEINELAVELGVKPLSLGCGSCTLNDAKRIFKALAVDEKANLG